MYKACIVFSGYNQVNLEKHRYLIKYALNVRFLFCVSVVFFVCQIFVCNYDQIILLGGLR